MPGIGGINTTVPTLIAGGRARQRANADGSPRPATATTSAVRSTSNGFVPGGPLIPAIGEDPRKRALRYKNTHLLKLLILLLNQTSYWVVRYKNSPTPNPLSCWD